MSSDDSVRIFVRYARLWAVVTLSAATALGVILIALGPIVHLKQALDNALSAIGEAIIASIILYVLVSLFLDPVRQRMQMREMADYAIEVSNRRFQERFEAALPMAVFESSSTPKAAFREAFAKLLINSSRYDVKGSACEFTTFRLAMSCTHPRFQKMDQIRLCLLDPTVESRIQAYAKLQIKQRRERTTSTSIALEVESIRTEIFVSLVALHDIRDTLRTTVFFHQDLPFFRCEMFDGGMFLTYYLDGVDYPETLQFAKNSRPYQAYRDGIELTRNYKTRTVVFDAETSPDSAHGDAAIEALLATLGCRLSLAELRVLRDERFLEFTGMLHRSGMSEAELF